MNFRLIKQKKSQAWGIDLMIAAFIFSIGIITFYIYTLNNYGTGGEAENLEYEGNFITDILMSEGYPENWTADNVLSIGILTEGKINQSKLENFYALASADYSKTKRLFNTKYDYYFFLEGNIDLLTSGADEIRGIGKPGINPEDINSENLVKITRFTIYEEKPVTAYLYVWE